MWATIILFVLAALFGVIAGAVGKNGIEHYAETSVMPAQRDTQGRARPRPHARAEAYKAMWLAINPYAFNYAVCTLLAWICLILGLARVLMGLI